MQKLIYDLKVSKKVLFNNVSKMYPNDDLTYKGMNKRNISNLIVGFYENYKKFNVGVYTNIALNSRITSLLKCAVLNIVDDVIDEAIPYIVHCVNLNMSIDETIKYVKENVRAFDEYKE